MPLLPHASEESLTTIATPYIGRIFKHLPIRELFDEPSPSEYARLQFRGNNKVGPKRPMTLKLTTEKALVHYSQSFDDIGHVTLARRLIKDRVPQVTVKLCIEHYLGNYVMLHVPHPAYFLRLKFELAKYQDVFYARPLTSGTLDYPCIYDRDELNVAALHVALLRSSHGTFANGAGYPRSLLVDPERTTWIETTFGARALQRLRDAPEAKEAGGGGDGQGADAAPEPPGPFASSTTDEEALAGPFLPDTGGFDQSWQPPEEEGLFAPPVGGDLSFFEVRRDFSSSSPPRPTPP
jgi:hypothetical protein